MRMLNNEDYEHLQSNDIAKLEAENTQLKQRIAQLSEMLNNSATDVAFRVENERDACERVLQFHLSLCKTEDEVATLHRAINAIKARKDPSVQWIQEMAHGTVLGEFVERMIKNSPAQG